MGSYDDTIAVGRVLYAGNLPIVPPDECWIPAKTDPVKLSIVPVGGIHIFIGETSIPTKPCPISGDTQSMDTEEFDRKVKELGYGEESEVDSVQPKQVLATVAALGENGSEDAGTQSDPQPSRHGSPMSRERPRKDSSSESLLSPEEMVAQAGMDAVYRSDILNKPITPEDVEALEAKRVELLATAKKFKDTAAAMLEERKHAAVFVEDFIQREQEVDAGLAQVKELRKHWEDKVVEAHKEVEKIRREMIAPRKITFATPTEQQPLATPKDNMTKAAELLKKSDEEIDINYLRTLVASAVKQQSKADTSRKLESNPEHCVSTAQKDAHDNRHRDDESRTGSSERRRKTREHPNPIPVPSKTPPSDPRKGKDPMYSGRDKYRNPSPPPNGYPRPPRRRSPAGNTRPQGHGGIVIRDNVLPSGNRNRERTPEPRRNQNNDREPEPRRSRNEERDPEPRRSRNDQGSQRHGEGSHRSRSQHRGESGGGSKRSDRPPRRMIREEPKPRSSLKLPGNLKHYDGTERPDTWIEDYYNAVTFAGGTPNIACRMLQLYLVGPARIWLSDLEKNSIFCWFDLKTAFEKHFRGTYKRPATASDLQACIQKKGESSRNFLTRWLACRNECENVDHTTAMYAFIGGLQRGGLLRHKLTCLANANKLTLDEMISIASDHTAADDDAGGDLAATAIPLHQQKKNRDNGNNIGHAKTTMTRRVADPTWSPWRSSAEVQEAEEDAAAEAEPAGVSSMALKEVHSTNRNDLKNDPEAGYKRARKHRPRGKGGKGKNKDKEESSYHVIFDRPTYHKFHARACYIYNKLKMPGPNGMITITGDYKKAHECELRARLRSATYQRTMQRCLKDQIGRNVHAYVDDIAVMTRKGSDLISDLTETFENLRRFVSRLGEKALPLYKLLKKTDKFVWDDAADAALRATNKVISLVIVVERKEEGHEYDVQRPVYYISEVLTESKQRYPHFQKLAYGVFLGSRKLRHYFQEHPVTVVSKAPLSTILNNADATGRTAKWGIELSAFDIAYKPRTAVKSQVLADFVADWTEAPDASLEPEPETWVMHFDGSKQHQGSEPESPLKSPIGEELRSFCRSTSKLQTTWRNTRLYYTVRIAKEIGIKHIICCGDSDTGGTTSSRNLEREKFRHGGLQRRS
ncbi:hypothetical protein QYE76_050072 [Lolium multiflorum]|uniref:Retrotransposon gag domain-containing protein n=1 Tax=Lolium multiflorum TaxID=4521 RepID=A0AAD8WIV9_LOLMU|nr:hypothetical protein QYE76_050072 [Lolium multiflorum]